MNSTSKKVFVIEISSNLDYENMIANVLYEEELVAIVSQEQGNGLFEIEIFSHIDTTSWKFLLDDFLDSLQRAKKHLICNSLDLI